MQFFAMIEGKNINLRIFSLAWANAKTLKKSTCIVIPWFLMDDIRYIERSTGSPCVEKVYGRRALSLLYGTSCLSRLFAFVFLPLLARVPLFSKFYGFLQKLPGSKRKIKPFIEAYQINTSEFADAVESFRCFNDFFIRKLKPERRPIDRRPEIATLPADGRYLVYPDLQKVDGFYIKDQQFDLGAFLQEEAWGKRYSEGSMAIVRLCPTDYHRFHFPVNGKALETRNIPGTLYSVNPIALAKRLPILWENKRAITEIETDCFGTVSMVEVGATCVGTIHQTFQPNSTVAKGDEKGYFSFGGSCIVLLFEKGVIEFDIDLVKNSENYLETMGLFGSSLGKRKCEAPSCTP